MIFRHGQHKCQYFSNVQHLFRDGIFFLIKSYQFSKLIQDSRRSAVIKKQASYIYVRFLDYEKPIQNSNFFTTIKLFKDLNLPPSDRGSEKNFYVATCHKFLQKIFVFEKVFIDSCLQSNNQQSMICKSLNSQLIYGQSNVLAYEGLINQTVFPLPESTYMDCKQFQQRTGVSSLLRFPILRHSIIQEGKRLFLLGETIFTAKKYFDILLSHSSTILEEQIIPIIVGCLRTAVKLCEPQKVSELYTLQYAVDQCDQVVAASFFLDVQFRILSLLQMKTKLITPYWYMEVVQNLFPEQDFTLDKLTSIIDFSMLQPELFSASAEQLFFSALIAFFKYKKSSPICYQIVKAITPKWQQALQIAQFLSERLNSSS